MLLAHQPAHVAEEEAPVGIVGVGVRITVFVVQSVVSDPNVKAVLEFYIKYQIVETKILFQQIMKLL